MMLARLFAICVFSVNMRASLQLPPPWHRALERRLDIMARNLAEENKELWKELYSISSKLDEYVGEMSNSSVEMKKSPVVTAGERRETEQKMEINSGDIEALVKGLNDEKEHVRDYITKAEQQRQRTQEDLHDRMESMDKRVSERIMEVNNYVSSKLTDSLNNTNHVRVMTDNLETTVIHIQSEVTGLKDEMVRLHPNCGSWHVFKRSYYLIFNKLMTWEDARDSCIAAGAYLAEVESEEEARFLINLTKSAVNVDGGWGPWLGASDTNSEGDWVWQLSGRSVSLGFSDWTSVSDEPNGGTRENCLHMHKFGPQPYHWNDTPCTLETNFICEK